MGRTSSVGCDVNGEEFRKVMSRFATGIAIVTSRSGNLIHGMTCNAFCSISLCPMCVLVSLQKETRTERIIKSGSVFAVSILSDGQIELSDRFAGKHKDKESDRFEGIEWHAVVTGAPVLEHSQAYLDCSVSSIFDGGSHSLFLGQVLAFHLDESKRPLIFFHSRYMTIDSAKFL
jgi:flavin reductase (DIM6/NTAB) family NADH-FMN oxidoreductase RutF